LRVLAVSVEEALVGYGSGHLDLELGPETVKEIVLVWKKTTKFPILLALRHVSALLPAVEVVAQAEVEDIHHVVLVRAAGLTRVLAVVGIHGGWNEWQVDTI